VGSRGVTVAGGVGVVIDSTGQLVATVTSPVRNKEQLRSMAESSKATLSFKPVSFRYKKELAEDGYD